MSGDAASRGIGYDVAVPSMLLSMAWVFGRVLRCP